MENTTTIRSMLFPNLLRKGDVITVAPGGVIRDVKLTEPPVFGVIVFGGHDCPVYYLTGIDLATNNKPFKTVESARAVIETTRELVLNGRPAPTYYRPTEPEFLY